MMQHICLNVTIRKDIRATPLFCYEEYRATPLYATVIMGRSPKIFVEKQ